MTNVSSGSIPIITLPGARPTTALGLGTTSLLGLGSASERLALLECAFDLGIRHFDTAPYYGYGEAERILGRFIESRRAAVTVTNKFGIQPPRVAGFAALVAVARRVARVAAPLKRMLSRRAGQLVKRGAFGAADARKSLAASLRALRTDHLDFFLLHEAGVENTTSPELRAFLDDAVARGVIRAYGVGSAVDKVLAVAAQSPAYARVVQFENNVLHRQLERLPGAAGRTVITHGPVGPAFQRLHRTVAENPALARRWSDALTADCADAAVLAELMMGYAARANAGGIVLFSTRSRAHLEAGVRAFAQPRFSGEQLGRFAALVESCASATVEPKARLK